MGVSAGGMVVQYWTDGRGNQRLNGRMKMRTRDGAEGENQQDQRRGRVGDGWLDDRISRGAELTGRQQTASIAPNSLVLDITSEREKTLRKRQRIGQG